MEKYRWKQKLGVGIIRAYERQRRLEPGEWEYLGLQLAYPEKFWKTASSYCRSNKAWLPEKSVEKLELAVNQEEEKTNFLKTILFFSISEAIPCDSLFTIPLPQGIVKHFLQNLSKIF